MVLLVLPIFCPRPLRLCHSSSNNAVHDQIMVEGQPKQHNVIRNLGLGGANERVLVCKRAEALGSLAVLREGLSKGGGAHLAVGSSHLPSSPSYWFPLVIAIRRIYPCGRASGRAATSPPRASAWRHRPFLARIMAQRPMGAMTMVRVPATTIVVAPAASSCMPQPLLRRQERRTRSMLRSCPKRSRRPKLSGRSFDPPLLPGIPAHLQS
jgi:hypothetical protein